MKPREPIHAEYHDAIRLMAEEQPFYGYLKVALELQSRNV